MSKLGQKILSLSNSFKFYRDSYQKQKDELRNLRSQLKSKDKTIADKDNVIRNKDSEIQHLRSSKYDELNNLRSQKDEVITTKDVTIKYLRSENNKLFNENQVLVEYNNDLKEQIKINKEIRNILGDVKNSLNNEKQLSADRFKTLHTLSEFNHVDVANSIEELKFIIENKELLYDFTQECDVTSDDDEDSDVVDSSYNN